MSEVKQVPRNHCQELQVTRTLRNNSQRRARKSVGKSSQGFLTRWGVLRPLTGSCRGQGEGQRGGARRASARQPPAPAPRFACAARSRIRAASGVTRPTTLTFVLPATQSPPSRAALPLAVTILCTFAPFQIHARGYTVTLGTTVVGCHPSQLVLS